ncbi:hypothetical protein BV898_16272 [Hypsibius exemplaris]|uniref:Uncharacterized protein n=1 Tax=Hypsibius exemplaris TaxID=2072580 RepID=A0A9X6NCX9_HYPEX|nr:hypothetical protein BV898_16272 [Hypsibius exemplaris]
MSAATRHSLTALGNNLRNRYDDAFVRGEVTNLRNQVSVLHDTMLAFIDRVDKRLAAQDEEQKRTAIRLSRLERAQKLKPLRSPGRGAVGQPRQQNGSRSSAKKEIIGRVDTGESSGEPPNGPFPIMDEHGNPTHFVATFGGNGSGELVDGATMIQISSTLHGTEGEEAEDGGGEEDANNGNEDDASEDDEDANKEEEDEEYMETDEAVASISEPRTLQQRISERLALGKRRKSSAKKPMEPPGIVDWDLLESEAKPLISNPERKGKGGKVSGKLGAGSPAWTHMLRTAMAKSLGEEAMMRYARSGSRTFKSEQEATFGDIKEHVVDFCKRNDIVPPEEKLMDEIAWAFLRNKKRFVVGARVGRRS